MADTKSRILQRRAIFLSSALSLAAGCSKPTETNTPTKIGPTNEIVKRTDSPDASLAGPQKFEHCDLMSKIPDVNDAVVKEKLESYLSTLRHLEKIHKEAEEIFGKVQGPIDAGNEAEWLKAAQMLEQIKEPVFLMTCGAKSKEALLVDAYIRDQRQCIQKWRSDLVTYIEKKANDAGSSSQKKWDEFKAKSAIPIPCLSPALCPDW